MLHVSTWILVASLVGAGIYNAIGTEATRADFVRWGYPSWWGRPTGALEIASAALIALPRTRELGLIIGGAIIAAAIATVLRRREWSHLVPLGVFVALIALATAAGIGPGHA